MRRVVRETAGIDASESLFGGSFPVIISRGLIEFVIQWKGRKMYSSEMKNKEATSF